MSGLRYLFFSCSGLVQREFCQQQEYDASSRSQSPAEGYLRKGILSSYLFYGGLSYYFFLDKKNFNCL